VSQERILPQYPTPGSAFSYEVSEENGRILVHLEEESISLEMSPGKGSRGWCRAAGGAILPFAYAWVENDLHLWLDGDLFIFQPAEQRSRRQAGAGSAGGNITAPVPGKILKILVQIGDTVEADQPVITLESMKMEHLLKASGAGTVVRVLVDEGQQVERANLLMELSIGS
jgi:acetyl/propionyl-CoA carboxylase alpha subunit